MRDMDLLAIAIAVLVSFSVAICILSTKQTVWKRKCRDLGGAPLSGQCFEAKSLKPLFVE